MKDRELREAMREAGLLVDVSYKKGCYWNELTVNNPFDRLDARQIGFMKRMDKLEKRIEQLEDENESLRARMDLNFNTKRDIERENRTRLDRQEKIIHALLNKFSFEIHRVEAHLELKQDKTRPYKGWESESD